MANKTPKAEFTPTQDLILELLIARRRLGEHLWTLESRTLKQAEQLATMGWIHVMHGITEGTYRASFTDRGLARFLSYEYEPPLKVKGGKAVVKEAQALKERFGGHRFWATKEAQ